MDLKLEVEPAVYAKWQALLDLLKGLQSAVVAFSGGVDSGLLSVAAYQALGDRMLSVTIKSPVEISETMEVARKLAAQFNFPHQFVESDELENPQFRSNPADRCYHCKMMTFSELQKMASEKGLAYVVEGTNADDVSDYRPGRKASEELEVLTPLLQVGLKKPEIRMLAKALGMANWDMPSSPCLASRFPYGTAITRPGLDKVARGEAYLHGLGVRSVRVRFGGASVRIEVEPAEIQRLIGLRSEVLPFFKGLGFKYVQVDLEGYRQGSLNEVLTLAQAA
jgi:uncharacterized protein